MIASDQFGDYVIANQALESKQRTRVARVHRLSI